MWKRSELKTRGKAAFKANYTNCVIVGLILALIVGGGAASTGGGAAGGNSMNININDGSLDMIKGGLDGMSVAAKAGLGAAVLGLASAVGLLAIALKFFAFNPLEVNCRRFFFINSYSPAQLNELKFSFDGGRFSNVVKTMFFRDLYIFLWCLLLIIPGIVKSYSYKMVPYILAEDPFIDTKQAIDLSRAMMNGNKWKAFVLDLSFIGWIFLSVLTLGILGIFYTNPYIAGTDAELYRVLREDYVIQQ